MVTPFANLAADESGTTAIEYGVIAVLVSVAAISALHMLGSSLSATFISVSATVNASADTVAGLDPANSQTGIISVMEPSNCRGGFFASQFEDC